LYLGTRYTKTISKGFGGYADLKASTLKGFELSLKYQDKVMLI
jgi:hypothetical protein